jgi:5-methylcytosine-specific restriction enzyme subunit McrC
VPELTLREYQVSPGVYLTPHQRDELRRIAPSVSISPSPGTADRYDITPGSWIGAIHLGDLGIVIRPKIPIHRVLFMLSYTLDPKHWQQTGFDFAEEQWLVEAVIPGFVAQLHRALDRGLLRGYRTEEAALATVRGRLRIDDQLRTRFGMLPPVEVRYDEFTEDTEENRLLKAALARLRRFRVRSEPARRLLRAFDQRLYEVESVEYDGRSLPQFIYTRLNEHYRPAIELAKLILRGAAFELHHGTVQASAFLVDMNQIFEDFIVVGLRETLRLSERVFPQGATGRHLALDRAKAVELNPDISWWDGGRCTFVGDAKYKRVNLAGINHPDLYQVLAYALAADLPGGLLIYAAGEGEPTIHEVATVGREIEVLSLNLAGNPMAVLSEIAHIGERVQRLRSKAMTSRVA